MFYFRMGSLVVFGRWPAAGLKGGVGGGVVEYFITKLAVNTSL